MIKKHRHLILIGFTFAVLYSLISLVNHYLFRTYALDLGLYTNAVFKYAHFQLADSSMIKEFSEPILGGHFDLYLVLFSPLVYLFGTYTLLVVQIMAVISGGIGIYHYFRLIGNKDSAIPILAAIYFYSFFGVFGAFSYDYHSVVVASSIVPWFFAAVYRNKKALSAGLLLLMLVSQENISLWMFFICLGLLIEYRKDAKKTSHLLLLSAMSLLYFVTVINVFIPFFSSQDEYSGFLYSSLGSNTFEAFVRIVTHPIDSIKILFTNHNNSQHGDFIKAELHLIVLTSGLLLLIKKPQYLLMMLPIYSQKLFHDNYLMWGVGSQYNVEFAPIMAIGIFQVLSEIEKKKYRVIVTSIVLVLAVAATIRTMDRTLLFTDKTRIRFYQKKHYQKDYDVSAVHRQLATIPKDASVSAQSPFVPHLSLRNHIYQFPIIKNAEYIVYSRKEGSYPLSKETFDLKINELEHSKEWEVLHNNDVVILRKTGL